VSSAFREIITADDNSDHENHFHIEAFPDPSRATKSILSHHEPTNERLTGVAPCPAWMRPRIAASAAHLDVVLGTR